MIGIKSQNVLHNWGNSPSVFLTDFQECYLEPNENSMVELFCKNGNNFYLLTTFTKKIHHKLTLFDFVLKTPVLSLKKKDTNYCI